MTRMVDAFVAALDPGQRSRVEAMRTELESALDEQWNLGRQAWPGISVDGARFARHVAEKLSDSDDAAAAVRSLPGRDLYLACACADGDVRAIAAFEDAYLSEVDIAAASTGAGADIAEETKQILRERLFVAAEGTAPGIADFAGRGDLRGWLRVTAIRQVLRLLKRGKREVPFESVLAGEVEPIDPDLARLKEQYAREFNDSFREALSNMAPRERTMLRHQLIDKLSIDEIGALYGVHRATAARWLVKARSSLANDTQVRLAARLNLPATEIDSVIRLVQSQLDVTVERFLQDDGN